jgi:hypothetical protein
MGGFEGRQVVGYRNIDDALRKIYSRCIRVTADRCLDMPREVEEFRTARMDDAASRKYLQMERDCVAEFGGHRITAPMVMMRQMKLAEITGGFIYEAGADGKRVATHRIARAPKLRALADMLDESAGRKMVVWCRFTEEVDLIREMLDERGVKHVCIDGRVKVGAKGCTCGTCRLCLMHIFQNDPDVQVFIGQEATCSMGIALWAASITVYYSQDCNAETRRQTKDRTKQVGKKEPCLYVDLLAETAAGRKTTDHDTRVIVRGKEQFGGEVSRMLMQMMTERVSGTEASAKLSGMARDALAGARRRDGKLSAPPAQRALPTEDIMQEGEEF